MIPLHLPYYSQSARDSVKNFVLGLNEKNFHAELKERFQKSFSFKNSYLTKSCTNALEVIALLMDVKIGDEIIIPSYTFVSTANAFAIFGAKIVYADSLENNPNADTQSILNSITPKTKAIVVMHYGGVAIDNLNELRKVCDEKNIYLIEDAAHCIGAYLTNQHLGTFGHASTFSFHESKNITCIEGGLLVINHQPWLDKVDAILNKGTNRVQFEKKQAAFYEWVSLGSSFLMNPLHAAILVEQIKYVDEVNKKRVEIFNLYCQKLESLKRQKKIYFSIPESEKQHNAHNFWITLPNENERNSLQKHLTSKQIFSTFHYLALHISPFGKRFGEFNLPNSVKFEKTLLRLPLYYQQTNAQVDEVCQTLNEYFQR